MRIKTLPGPAPFTVQCPHGRRVRINCIMTSVSGVGNGDALIIAIIRSNEVLAQIPMPPMATNTTLVCAAIGIGVIQSIVLSFDPVTGVYSFSQALNVSAPLPNIWWDTDVNVTVTTASGSVIGGSLLTYEVTDEKNTQMRGAFPP